MALPTSLSDNTDNYWEREQRSASANMPRYGGQDDLSGRGLLDPSGKRPECSIARLDLYSGGTPDDYVPDLGAVGMRAVGYEPYEVSFAQPPTPDPPRIPEPQPELDEPQVSYSDCPMTEELFEHLMGEVGVDLDGRLDIASMADPQVDRDLTGGACDLEEIIRSTLPPEEPAPLAWLARDLVDANGRSDGVTRSVAEGIPPSESEMPGSVGPSFGLEFAPEPYGPVDRP